MVVGGALGWMIGIGGLAVPGIGVFIAAGPLMTALAGATIGGVAGALIGLGIPEYEAKRYEGKIRDGNILLSVHTSDRDQVSRSKEILKNGGADNISYTGEASVPKKTPRLSTSAPSREKPSLHRDRRGPEYCEPGCGFRR
jgi:hypothetical protein